MCDLCPAEPADGFTPHIRPCNCHMHRDDLFKVKLHDADTCLSCLLGLKHLIENDMHALYDYE